MYSIYYYLMPNKNLPDEIEQHSSKRFECTCAIHLHHLDFLGHYKYFHFEKKRNKEL